MEGYEEKQPLPEGLKSARALEFYQRIDLAGREELLEILLEALEARRSAANEETIAEITNIEYGYILYKVELKLNQLHGV